MSTPQQIQLPPQMIQQLLRGPTSSQTPPDAVEILSRGTRMAFNIDALERVIEYDDGTCGILLKGCSAMIQVDQDYDSLLLAAKITPRQLHAGHNQ